MTLIGPSPYCNMECDEWLHTNFPTRSCNVRDPLVYALNSVPQTCLYDITLNSFFALTFRVFGGPFYRSGVFFKLLDIINSIHTHPKLLTEESLDTIIHVEQVGTVRNAMPLACKCHKLSRYPIFLQLPQHIIAMIDRRARIIFAMVQCNRGSIADSIKMVQRRCPHCHHLLLRHVFAKNSLPILGNERTPAKCIFGKPVGRTYRGYGAYCHCTTV
mmetsp:Transcript_40021/g.96296  ORF Transcript_40021/g.96296 Transcript_40021/m.96296 type:complete len:216 (+) Transcript_40021:35-682(+)